ncbi:SDR family oxidoreductase [Hwanghaeella grinnelliae]|uniref:SDR family oxidoreductase n=1 Tax=Hwanghaeella grinnelliae TaxID=2500179 RepID=A0A3S3URE5_9PROT|nr:SDR family oxidoreductase [Hwanghaeella grinnelliae]RVU38838.1 SDR family oxidoreductase [Hwanghaeella grinnelliae]
MDLNLTGKRALVTGASSGIGYEVARILAREGVALAVAATNEGRLAPLVNAIVAEGFPAPAICTANLTDPDGPDSVAEQALAALGEVDILINNAGGSRPMQGVTPEEAERVWEESMTLNFTSCRKLTQAILPGMRERGWGRVVNISGALVYWNVNAATPAKAALTSWSKGLAAEVAKDGVTVNCVAPGRIKTRQIMQKLHPTEESRDAFIDSMIPIGRFGEPEEIASVIVFLASPIAGYVTGVTVPVDGGMHRYAF